MVRILAIILLALGGAAAAPAQEADDFLSSFFAVQEDEQVYLRWTIKGGNTCDGTRIQRSADQLNYVEIGEISGICGSPDLPVTYDFTDSLPEKNRINYYRLELGQYGFTSPLAVELIILNDDGYALHPNPLSTRSKLSFANPGAETLRFTLVNIQGKTVLQQSTNSNQLWIEGGRLRSGVYVFKLRSETKLFARGKLVVL